MSKRLSDCTVLANFSCSRWGGHRYDRGVSEEVHNMKGAQKDTGNFNKRLLPKGATSDIDAAVNAARAFHRANTLPWLDDGVRILPAVAYMKYGAAMKEFRQQFEDAVAEFFKEYPNYIKSAQGRLGKMYNEKDYPNASELRSQYSWDMLILPFPDKSDFRVQGLGDGSSGEDLDAIRADMERRMQGVYETAMRDLGSRIAETVGHMAERLRAYKPGIPGKRAVGTFQGSLVENVRELVEVLPQLNVMGDSKLAAIITAMQTTLCKFDADDLRVDAKLRGKVAKSAKDVLASVKDFMA